MGGRTTPREQFENRVGRDLDSQLKASTGTAITTDRPANCDDKYSWNLQKLRTTLIGYLEKAHKANPGYICHTDYVSLRAIYTSLDAVDSFTKPKLKCKNPWTFANLPSYRKWITADDKKPKKQLIDMIGTLVELIPVGCQIPAKFKSHYGDRVIALRDLIAVPNGLLPMLQGKIPRSLNDSADGDVSDNGYFIKKESPLPTAFKPRAAPKAKKLKIMTESENSQALDLPDEIASMDSLEFTMTPTGRLHQALKDLSNRNIPGNPNPAVQDRENNLAMMRLLADTFSRQIHADDLTDTTNHKRSHQQKEQSSSGRKRKARPDDNTDIVGNDKLDSVPEITLGHTKPQGRLNLKKSQLTLNKNRRLGKYPSDESDPEHTKKTSESNKHPMGTAPVPVDRHDDSGIQSGKNTRVIDTDQGGGKDVVVILRKLDRNSKAHWIQITPQGGQMDYADRLSLIRHLADGLPDSEEPSMAHDGRRNGRDE